MNTFLIIAIANNESNQSNNSLTKITHNNINLLL